MNPTLREVAATIATWAMVITTLTLLALVAV